MFLSSYSLSPTAAVLVFLTGAAGTGLVAADFFTGGHGDFLGLSLGWSFFFVDADFVNGVDDIMLNAGDKALKEGVAFFFVDDYGFNLFHSIKACLLAQMVHLGEMVFP
jgi:hypothetical protein